MVYPGYISTNLSYNSLTGKNLDRLGVQDSYHETGSSSDDISNSILYAMWSKQTELIYTKDFKHHIAIMIYYIFPELSIKLFKK